ncbi:uncharacterized protein FYW47_006756, partial [Aplochiton taeniatus]
MDQRARGGAPPSVPTHSPLPPTTPPEDSERDAGVERRRRGEGESGGAGRRDEERRGSGRRREGDRGAVLELLIEGRCGSAGQRQLPFPGRESNCAEGNVKLRIGLQAKRTKKPPKILESYVCKPTIRTYQRPSRGAAPRGDSEGGGSRPQKPSPAPEEGDRGQSPSLELLTSQSRHTPSSSPLPPSSSSSLPPPSAASSPTTPRPASASAPASPAARPAKQVPPKPIHKTEMKSGSPSDRLKRSKLPDATCQSASRGHNPTSSPRTEQTSTTSPSSQHSSVFEPRREGDATGPDPPMGTAQTETQGALLNGKGSAVCEPIKSSKTKGGKRSTSLSPAPGDVNSAERHSASRSHKKQTASHKKKTESSCHPPALPKPLSSPPMAPSSGHAHRPDSSLENKKGKEEKGKKEKRKEKKAKHDRREVVDRAKSDGRKEEGKKKKKGKDGKLRARKRKERARDDRQRGETATDERAKEQRRKDHKLSPDGQRETGATEDHGRPDQTSPEDPGKPEDQGTLGEVNGPGKMQDDSTLGEVNDPGKTQDGGSLGEVNDPGKPEDERTFGEVNDPGRPMDPAPSADTSTPQVSPGVSPKASTVSPAHRADASLPLLPNRAPTSPPSSPREQDSRPLKKRKARRPSWTKLVQRVQRAESQDGPLEAHRPITALGAQPNPRSSPPTKASTQQSDTISPSHSSHPNSSPLPSPTKLHSAGRHPSPTWEPALISDLGPQPAPKSPVAQPRKRGRPKSQTFSVDESWPRHPCKAIQAEVLPSGCEGAREAPVLEVSQTIPSATQANPTPRKRGRPPKRATLENQRGDAQTHSGGRERTDDFHLENSNRQFKINRLIGEMKRRNRKRLQEGRLFGKEGKAGNRGSDMNRASSPAAYRPNLAAAMTTTSSPHTFPGLSSSFGCSLAPQINVSKRGTIYMGKRRGRKPKAQSANAYAPLSQSSRFPSPSESSLFSLSQSQPPSSHPFPSPSLTHSSGAQSPYSDGSFTEPATSLLFTHPFSLPSPSSSCTSPRPPSSAPLSTFVKKSCPCQGRQHFPFHQSSCKLSAPPSHLPSASPATPSPRSESHSEETLPSDSGIGTDNNSVSERGELRAGRGLFRMGPGPGLILGSQRHPSSLMERPSPVCSPLSTLHRHPHPVGSPTALERHRERERHRHRRRGYDCVTPCPCLSPYPCPGHGKCSKLDYYPCQGHGAAKRPKNKHKKKHQQLPLQDPDFLAELEDLIGLFSEVHIGRRGWARSGAGQGFEGSGNAAGGRRRHSSHPIRSNIFRINLNGYYSPHPSSYPVHPSFPPHPFYPCQALHCGRKPERRQCGCPTKLQEAVDDLSFYRGYPPATPLYPHLHSSFPLPPPHQYAPQQAHHPHLLLNPARFHRRRSRLLREGGLVGEADREVAGGGFPPPCCGRSEHKHKRKHRHRHGERDAGEENPGEEEEEELKRTALTSLGLGSSHLSSFGGSWGGLGSEWMKTGGLRAQEFGASTPSWRTFAGGQQAGRVGRSEREEEEEEEDDDEEDSEQTHLYSTPPPPSHTNLFTAVALAAGGRAGPKSGRASWSPGSGDGSWAREEPVWTQRRGEGVHSDWTRRQQKGLASSGGVPAKRRGPGRPRKHPLPSPASSAPHSPTASPPRPAAAALAGPSLGHHRGDGGRGEDRGGERAGGGHKVRQVIQSVGQAKRKRGRKRKLAESPCPQSAFEGEPECDAPAALFGQAAPQMTTVQCSPRVDRPPRKRFQRAGLYSDDYKTTDPLPQPSQVCSNDMEYTPGQKDYSLLPAPIHVGKYLRLKRIDFQLPYDVMWLWRHNQLHRAPAVPMKRKRSNCRPRERTVSPRDLTEECSGGMADLFPHLDLEPMTSTERSFVVTHHVFLVRNWELVRERQIQLRMEREGEREGE